MDNRRQGLQQPLLSLSTIEALAFSPSPFLRDLLWPIRCESCDQVPVPNIGLGWPWSSLFLSQKLARLPWKQAQVSLLEHERCVKQISPHSKCKDPDTQWCLMCVTIRQKSDWAGSGKKWGWRNRPEPDQETPFKSLNYHCSNGQLLKGFNQGSSWLDFHSRKTPLASRKSRGWIKGGNTLPTWEDCWNSPSKRREGMISKYFRGFFQKPVHKRIGIVLFFGVLRKSFFVKDSGL